MKKVLTGVIALIILGVGGLFYLGQKSQSGAALGLVEGRLASCPSSPNCVSSETSASTDNLVDPLRVGIWAKLPEIIDAMGGQLITQDVAYVSAEFTSSAFGFVDDVEFRLTEDAVHLRSASRVGYSDQGVNRSRVSSLREKPEI